MYIYIYYPLFCKTLHLMMQNPWKNPRMSWSKPMDLRPKSRRLGAPDYFGDRALLGSEIRSASIAALEERIERIGAPGRAIEAKTGPGNLWKSPTFMDFMEKHFGHM